MKKYVKNLRTAALFCILLVTTEFFCVAGFAHAEVTSKQVMDKTYGKFDVKQKCWYKRYPEKGHSAQRYCMEIRHSDTVNTNDGKKLYVIATGYAVNSNGEPDGSYHAQSGLVAAFVAEDRNNKTSIIGSEPSLPMGANGEPPSGWKFVKLGTADQWGWLTKTDEDCNQGICLSQYSILTTCKSRIIDVGRFTATFESPGFAGNPPSLEDFDLEIDSSHAIDTYYPIRLTRKQQIVRGKEWPPETWELPFNSSSCSFLTPKDLPLSR